MSPEERKLIKIFRKREIDQEDESRVDFNIRRFNEFKERRDFLSIVKTWTPFTDLKLLEGLELTQEQRQDYLELFYGPEWK